MRNVRLSPPARTQHGAALLLFVIALVMAASYALLKKVNQAPGEALRDNHTMQQLKTARDALRGFALRGLDPETSTVQPGRLPCPDYTLDGVSDPCPPTGGNIQLGRLPWRTLGVGELRDAGNEPLWYLPAVQFTAGQVITSNINSTALRLDGSPENLIAIVLAPGTVLSGQSRPAGNLSAQLDPARYFEDINALAGVNYVTMPASNSTPFNDRLLAIRLDRFMPELEMRVIKELANVLNKHLTDGYNLPYPADFGDTLCDSGRSDGLLPTTIGAPPCDTLPAYPPWFDSNWQSLILYAMEPGFPATNIAVALTDGTTVNVQALLFSPGAAIGTQSRPATSASDLLEGTENTDGPPYEEPVNSATNNDQLLIVTP